MTTHDECTVGLFDQHSERCARLIELKRLLLLLGYVLLFSLRYRAEDCSNFKSVVLSTSEC